MRWLVFLLSCFHLLGLTIFLKGFLLTRQTLDQHSTFYDAWDRFPLGADPSTRPSLPPLSPPSPAFKRMILVVIDALRFDFMVSDPQLAPRPYRNHLPIIDRLLHGPQRNHTHLFQFRADPPTTTMQRIKGLMTGSLPTFIDAGSNFASSSVQEDHLLHHLAARFPLIHFMGDDTWQHLFPNSLAPNRTFASDSFKMFDLHTVDDRIQAHLWPLLEGDDGDWQIVITHFLGVDHCGHTYGPDHVHMAGKLDEMDGVLTRLVDEHVDQDTLLVVLGDHGMSVEGDHGGESIEELMSGLFLYSGRRLRHDGIDDLITRLHEARSSILGYDADKITERLDYNASTYPIVPQIHLVPTLAYLLHLPIPFGNLGALIPDLVHNGDDGLLHMAQHFRMNALQVHDYLLTYGSETQHLGFTEHALAPLIDLLLTADATLAQALVAPPNDYNDLLEMAILGYDRFLSTTIKYCEAIWAQFDVGCMMVGMMVLGLTTITGLLLLFWTPRKLCATSLLRQVLFSFWPWMVCLVALVISQAPFQGMFDKMGWMDVCACVIGLIVTMALVSHVQPTSLVVDYDTGVLLVAAILQALTLGSNSFVVWEDRGTRFTATTLCVVWFLRRIGHQQPRIKAVVRPGLVLLWFRLGGFIGQCREEQYPYCNYVDSGLLKTIGGWMVWVGVFGLVLALYIKWMVRQTRLRCISVLYTLCVLAVYLRMADSLYQTAYDHSLGYDRAMDIYLPRFVYAATVGGTLYLWQFAGSSSTKYDICFSVLHIWSALLALLQRPLGGMVILLSPCVIHLLSLDDPGAMIRLALIHTLGHHLFFVTGHQATFTSLPWHAAFIGFDDMYYYIGAVLVSLSTLTGYILAWMGTWTLLSKQQDRQAGYTFMLLLHCIPTFLSSLFVFILRRHLMTWKIFAPRFLLQALLVAGTFVAHLVFQSWS
jgi:hypothetical protein